MYVFNLFWSLLSHLYWPLSHILTCTKSNFLTSCLPYSLSQSLPLSLSLSLASSPPSLFFSRCDIMLDPGSNREWATRRTLWHSDNITGEQKSNREYTGNGWDFVTLGGIHFGCISSTKMFQLFKGSAFRYLFCKKKSAFFVVPYRQRSIAIICIIDWGEVFG